MIALSGAAALLSVTLAAQQAPPPQPAPPAGAPPAQGQPGGGGGRGFGRAGAPPEAYDNYTGFTKLWDGATFTNWNGESDVWSIEDGMLHADTTKTPGQHHIYYTGPGAVMRDFDLKVEVKLSAMGANGGVQYRSRLLHASHGGSIQDPLGKPLPANIKTFQQAIDAGLATAPPPRGGGPGGPGGRGGNAPAGANAPGAGGNAGGGGRGGANAAAAPPVDPCVAAQGRGGPNGPTNEPNPWQVSGYQLDLDSNNGFSGQLYEGQGRGIVTPPGAIVQLRPCRVTARIGTITDDPRSILKPHLGKDGEWNQLEIIARGNTLIHMINGKVISITIDDNPDFRAAQGILSLQLEGSGQIWYRNVYVKPLDPK